MTPRSHSSTAAGTMNFRYCRPTLASATPALLRFSRGMDAFSISTASRTAPARGADRAVAAGALAAVTADLTAATNDDSMLSLKK